MGRKSQRGIAETKDTLSPTGSEQGDLPFRFLLVEIHYLFPKSQTKAFFVGLAVSLVGGFWQGSLSYPQQLECWRETSENVLIKLFYIKQGKEIGRAHV